MTTSVLDLFSIGIGPSSSHTVGPMRAAHHFVQTLANISVTRVQADLYGSLALTGKGHGTDHAILLGLSGFLPDTLTIKEKSSTLAQLQRSQTLMLNARHPMAFTPETDMVFHLTETLPEHANGLRLSAFVGNQEAFSQVYYSVGGGFVCLAGGAPLYPLPAATVPHPFTSAAELLRLCSTQRLTISQLMWENESRLHPPGHLRTQLLRIWEVMNRCIQRGLLTEGVLPGGLNVHRRAPGLFQRLQKTPEVDNKTAVLDWLSVYAMAVSEENAAGGQVVTAPTNGAAGVLPAVLKYYVTHLAEAAEQVVIDYLLTAGAIGILYKEGASLSAAEVGCQGEVGVACSMAAGALAAIQGGSPEQIENAAEIGMEHNLGLTCDPIGGLVQIPCIERNTMGAVKAVNAAHLALNADGTHLVSLDKVIATMLKTGRDMQHHYKETSLGGLAIQVAMPEC